LSAAALRVDQSALTGESRPVAKRPASGDSPVTVPYPDRQELVFAGTSVLSGSADMLVVGTGMRTEIGAIAYLTADGWTSGAPSHERSNARIRPVRRSSARATRWQWPAGAARVLVR
jgi:Ca2+-transporting ATPase